MHYSIVLLLCFCVSFSAYASDSAQGRAECQPYVKQVESAYVYIQANNNQHVDIVRKNVGQLYPLIRGKAFDNVFLGVYTGVSVAKTLSYVLGYCTGTIELMEEIEKTYVK